MSLDQVYSAKTQVTKLVEENYPCGNFQPNCWNTLFLLYDSMKLLVNQLIFMIFTYMHVYICIYIHMHTYFAYIYILYAYICCLFLVIINFLIEFN